MIVKYTFEILKAGKLFDMLYNKTHEDELDEGWDRHLDSLQHWLFAYIDHINEFEKNVEDDTRTQFITKITKKIEVAKAIKDHNKREEFLKSYYDEKKEGVDYFHGDVYVFRSYWNNKVSDEADKILHNKKLTSIDKVYKLGRLYRNEGILDDSMCDLWYAILEMKDEHISEIRQEEEPEYFDDFKRNYDEQEEVK